MDAKTLRKIVAVVQYDGTDFYGFQRQARGRTVQEALEAGLGELLGHSVTVKAAGRTDSGVHARGQVISLRTSSTIPSSRISEAVAAYLPPDVVVAEATEAPEGFDPQMDAVSKTYCYRIWRGGSPDVLTGRYSHWRPGQLDLGLMEEEASSLLGRHDFVSFRATGSSAKTTVREVMHAAWTRVSLGSRGEMWEFWITADGFLYKMVRLIVGTLLDVGRGHLSTGTVKRLLEEPGSGRAGQCAPSKGLCLEKVAYQNDLTQGNRMLMSRDDCTRRRP